MQYSTVSNSYQLTYSQFIQILIHFFIYVSIVYGKWELISFFHSPYDHFFVLLLVILKHSNYKGEFNPWLHSIVFAFANSTVL